MRCLDIHFDNDDSVLLRVRDERQDGVHSAVRPDKEENLGVLQRPVRGGAYVARDRVLEERDGRLEHRAADLALRDNLVVQDLHVVDEAERAARLALAEVGDAPVQLEHAILVAWKVVK